MASKAFDFWCKAVEARGIVAEKPSTMRNDDWPDLQQDMESLLVVGESLRDAAPAPGRSV